MEKETHFVSIIQDSALDILGKRNHFTTQLSTAAAEAEAWVNAENEKYPARYRLINVGLYGTQNYFVIGKEN